MPWAILENPFSVVALVLSPFIGTPENWEFVNELIRQIFVFLALSTWSEISINCIYWSIFHYDHRLEHPLHNYGTICARKGNALNELRANQKSDQQQKSPLQNGMTVTCNVVPLAFVVIINFLRGVNCSSISGTCLGAWKTGFGPNTDRSDKPTPFATLNTIIIFNLFSNVWHIPGAHRILDSQRIGRDGTLERTIF